MTLYQLMYLSETARCGSISQAAKNLHISQPALSESIIELEKEYSIKIFIRSKKGVSLTSEGEQFISHVRRILSNIDEMNAHFTTHSNDEPLKISSTKLPFVYKTFKDFYLDATQTDSKNTMVFLEKFSPDILNDIYTGKSSLGLVLIAESSEETWKRYMDNYNLEYNYLLSCTPQIVMRKGHPLCSLTSLSEKDLINYPLIYTYQSQDHAPNNNNAYTSYELKNFKKILYIYNQSTVFDFISTSDAICFMSCITGLTTLRNDLCALPCSYAEKWNSYWIKQKNHVLNSTEKRFLESQKTNIDLP